MPGNSSQKEKKLIWIQKNDQVFIPKCVLILGAGARRNESLCLFGNSACHFSRSATNETWSMGQVIRCFVCLLLDLEFYFPRQRAQTSSFLDWRCIPSVQEDAFKSFGCSALWDLLHCLGIPLVHVTCRSARPSKAFCACSPCYET